MSKPKIKILDAQFAHSGLGSFGTGDLCIEPKSMEWYRGQEIVGDVCVITEGSFHLMDSVKEKIKVGLILESPLLTKQLYDRMKGPEYFNKFDYVLTYCKELQAAGKKFVHYDFGGAWIKESDRKVYEKTKNISIIASFKKLTPWQRLRHDAIEYLSNHIDGIYGNGYNPVHYKLEALAPYRYTIITENDVVEGFFTEKLIDAMLTGTFPIYCGCDAVMDIFNIEGMLRFRTLKELEYCLSIATEELYYNSMAAINDNFNRALDYCIPEDRIYKDFFKPILGL